MILPDVTITVSVEVEHGSVYAIRKTIAGPYAAAYQPMDTCDEPLMQWAHGSKSSSMAKVVIRKREQFADELAKSLSKELLASMSTKDTINGYPIKKDNPQKEPR